MSKLDLKKERKDLYTAPADAVAEVDVPPTRYLMVDGKGDPNTSQEYKDAVQALFSLSYALKFAAKKEGADFAVMPLEGLWWTDEPGEFDPKRKDEFRWTAMIAQPEVVTDDLLAAAREKVRKKKKELPALDRVRLETYDEGRSVQTLHVGSYEDEHPTIQRLHAHARERGLAPRGHHHEIYLSDPSRTLFRKLKTILRQPVE